MALGDISATSVEQLARLLTDLRHGHMPATRVHLCATRSGLRERVAGIICADGNRFDR